MDSDDTDVRRQRLLQDMFGAEVPSGLDGNLLRTSDVAVLFQVSERTVSDWARRGRIPSVRTPGGHRRYPAERIRGLVEASGAQQLAQGLQASTDASGTLSIPWASPTGP